MKRKFKTITNNLVSVETLFKFFYVCADFRNTVFGKTMENIRNINSTKVFFPINLRKKITP